MTFKLVLSCDSEKYVATPYRSRPSNVVTISTHSDRVAVLEAGGGDYCIWKHCSNTMLYMVYRNIV